MFKNRKPEKNDPRKSNANRGDKTVISGLCWYTCYRYGILITVGGDFSQTGIKFFINVLDLID